MRGKLLDLGGVFSGDGKETISGFLNRDKVSRSQRALAPLQISQITQSDEERCRVSEGRNLSEICAICGCL